MITIDESKLQIAALDSNIKFDVQDNKLVLVVDITKDLGLSSSGKMRAVANTSGFTPLFEGLRANIYIGRKVA